MQLHRCKSAESEACLVVSSPSCGCLLCEQETRFACSLLLCPWQQYLIKMEKQGDLCECESLMSLLKYFILNGMIDFLFVCLF